MADGDGVALAAIQDGGSAPPDAGAKAEMAPILAAGVDLARRMMWMISGALLLLVILLALSECSEQRSAGALNEIVLKAIDNSDPRPETAGLSPVVATLRHAAQDSAWVAPADDVAAVKTMIELALKSPAIDDVAHGALDGKCVPFPAAALPDRASTLTRCAATLEAMLGRRDTSEMQFANMQAMAKSMADERAAHRAFWLQVAQLILINLLLPILTALLGYIFGTQQGSRAT